MAAFFRHQGKTYVDFMMGWCVGNFGWGNAVLLEAAAQFEGPDYVYPGYSYAPWIELAIAAGVDLSARLVEMLSVPRADRKPMDLCPTGGDDSYRPARVRFSGRAAIMAIHRRISVAPLGEPRESGTASHCFWIKPPLNAQSLDGSRTGLKGSDVAAFIMEPISINLGVLIPGHVSCMASRSAGNTAPC